jgi:hypothetical protein
MLTGFPGSATGKQKAFGVLPIAWEMEHNRTAAPARCAFYISEDRMGISAPLVSLFD